MHPDNQVNPVSRFLVLSVQDQSGRVKLDFPRIYMARPIRQVEDMTVWVVFEQNTVVREHVGCPSEDDPYPYLDCYVKTRHPEWSVLGTWHEGKEMSQYPDLMRSM